MFCIYFKKSKALLTIIDRRSYLRKLLREEKFVEVIMTQFVEAGPSFQLQDLILAPNTLSQCHFYLTNWFPTKVLCHYILNIYKTLKIICNISSDFRRCFRW